MKITPVLAVLLQAAAITAHAADRLAPALADPVRAEPVILIPAAGSVEGANGTFFRSDVQILNLRADETQRIELHWLPQAGSGDAAMRIIEIAPDSRVSSEDFVSEVMQQTGLGAIVIRGIDEEGDPDPQAKLHAVSRIWTPQPGTEGTTSQSFSPVSVRALDERRLSLIGIRRDDRYRANVGIVNADPDDAHEYELTISGIDREGEPWGPVEMQLTVPSWSLVQFPLRDVPDLHTLQVEVGPVLTEPESTPRPWIAYGSSVDNITGDAWSHIGFPTIEAIQPD